MTKQPKVKALGETWETKSLQSLVGFANSKRFELLRAENPNVILIEMGDGIIFDRAQVRSLIAHLQAWLDTGSFKISRQTKHKERNRK